MKLQCPACDHEMSTATSMPRFCSNCGASLVEIIQSLEQGHPAAADASAADKPGGDVTAPLDVTAAFSRPLEQGSTQRGQGQETKVASTVDGSGNQILPPGSEIGPFKIVKALGAGGMGAVYEATHRQSGQRVALKLLSKSVRTTDETVQRFQRESQIAASINHPRSTFVYGASQHEEQFYITMELMAGGTLDDIVKRDGPIEFGQAVDYVLDMIDGLKAAHEVGIVHRDLKPSNCFIDQTGRVKIGDFGLAKSFVADSSLTQTGAFMGTPQYAAPEQLRTSDVDERADIYAIGGTLFYLLVARPPFVGNAAQVISSIASETPPRVSALDKSIPKQLCRIIHQTLEKNPDKRPENLQELRQMLLPFSTRGATEADPGRRMAAFFADVILIGFVNGLFGNIIGVSVQLIPSSIDNLFLANLIVSVAVGILYFAIAESRYGTTVGKWLFGMRVTNLDLRPPDFGQALVRATIMPGIMYVADMLPTYLSGLPTAAEQEVDSVLALAAGIIFLQLSGWVVAALCFVTARKSNGFRGVHELVSKTKVVRLSGELESQRLHNVPVTLPVTSSLANAIRANDVTDATQKYVAPQMSGEFKVVGELGQCGDLDCTVLLGRDEALDRDVWILDSSSDSLSVDMARKSISRPARVRILGEHHEEAGSSVITEAVKGMPLPEYIRITPSLDWRSFRLLLHELAQELDQAQRDGSMPQNLCLAQVWVDEGGHAKLLDHPIRPAVGLVATQVDSSEEDAVFQQRDFAPAEPVGLVTGLLDAFVQQQVVPAHVLTFRQELEVIGSEDQPFKKISERLTELADLPSAWRWDDRTGVLAVTTGLEGSILVSLLVSMVLLLAMAEPSVWLAASTTLLVSSLAVLVLGSTTHGGPVFRVSGVLVRRNKTLAPATPVRCAVRSLVAWSPLILGVTLLAMIMAIQINQAHHQNEWAADGDWLTLLMSLFLLPLIGVAGLAGLYSILRPSRGIQDVICGTRLIRK